MSGKVKTRFTTIDVTAMVTELRNKLVGLRINNIYDLNTKTYVFKLTKTETKEFLIMESGVRFHTLLANAEKKKIPTPFTMKLRKYLREKRLEDIQQIGVERVVDFTFGRDDSAYHIILELYASGNLILTDSQYKILALIRSHEFSETVRTAVGEVYPFEQAANLKLESFRTDNEYIEQLINQEPAAKAEAVEKVEKAPQAVAKGSKPNKNQKNDKDKKDKKDGKDKDKDKDKDKAKKNVKKLKDILFRLIPCYHQAMIDQILRDKDLNPNTKAGEEHVPILQEIARDSIEFMRTFGQRKPAGYIVYKQIEANKAIVAEDVAAKQNGNSVQEVEVAKPDDNQVKKGEEAFQKYIEFSPIPLKTTDQVKEMDSFDKVVDEFFGRQQLPDPQKNKEEKERIAWRKYENIKHDQETRVKKLKDEQDECVAKALLIEHNLKNVDVIINIVGAMVQGGLGWDKIWKMINESKNNGDPFASMISKLKLESNQAVILLDNPDEIDKGPKEVEVDVRSKAFINAERYYQEKKKLEIKEKKTAEALGQALKLAEKAAMTEINNVKQKSHALVTRKTFWFEKFYWFLTSENFIVISGRDAQQNEMLVKKYLHNGDLYMHADIHGAGSVVIKNPTQKPVPKLSLDEAAIFTVCRSKAWESKIITSAWWVYDHQVSKTAPSGEYLPTGSFMIRGKKNFLNPSRLEMGFGLLFKADESSLARHENDRKAKYEEDDEAQSASITPKETVALDDEQFYITGQDVRRIDSIIQSYQKPKQGAKPKETPKNVVQEEKKSLTFDDDDDDEDEFKALRKPSNKNFDDDDNKSKNNDGKAEDKLKNLPNQKLPRGKKAKIQKMKEKYGDQDEEEKELRFKLTGAKNIKELRKDEDDDFEDDRKGKKKEKGKDKDKGNKQKGNKPADQGQKPKQNNPKGPNQPPAQNQNKKVEPQSNAPKPEKVEKQAPIKQEEPISANIEQAKTELPKNGQNAAHDVKVEPVKAAAEQPTKAKEIKEDDVEIDKDIEKDDEEDIGEIEYNKEDLEAEVEAEKENTNTEAGPTETLSEETELKLLISNPHPEDLLVFGVPVCAPYSTLNNYKYRCKLVPGTLKKGKAVKTVMSVFLSQKDLPEFEKKLMKSMNEPELVNAMIGNVKIGAAGLLKVKEKEKKAKEQKKKEIRSQEKKNNNEKK